MLAIWKAKKILRELERLGVQNSNGRLYRYDGVALSDSEVLRRLKALPDGAGSAAVDAALSERPT